MFVFLGLFLLVKCTKNISETDDGKVTSGVCEVLSRCGGVKRTLLITIILGLLIQIKVYAGILIMIALIISGIWDYIKQRNRFLLIMFTISLVVSIVVLLPTFDIRVKSLIFQPFWFLESVMATSDRFYWPKMASALLNYKLSGNIIKGTLAYTLSFMIFFIGNLGVRIISFPWILRSVRKFNELNIFELIIFSVIIFGTFLPMFFVQNGNPWNTIQFFYYSQVFLSVICGITIGEFIEKQRNSKSVYVLRLYHTKVYLVLLLIFVLTVPVVVATLRNYLPSRPPAKISKEELQALKFLKSLPEGIVLTLPFSKVLADKAISNPPRPLYLYESTAYVSGMSGKQTFLEDEVNLEITGYNWRERLDEVINNINNISYLKSRNISYIYIPDKQSFRYRNEFASFIIYDQDNFVIYKLN